MERNWSLGLADRPFDPAVLTFFGIHDLRPNESLDPRIDLSAYTLSSVVDQLCQPAVVIDFTVCETWFRPDELVAIVSGATRLASEFAPPIVEEPNGTTIVPCFWDLERNPVPQEPYFDWVVGLQATLLARGDEPTERWNRRIRTIERALECRPTSLPDGQAACIDESKTSTEVVVRMGGQRAMVLRADSSTTGGEPDYPTSELHQMTRQVAVAFAQRLSE
jgi:hypothetical protein